MKKTTMALLVLGLSSTFLTAQGGRDGLVQRLADRYGPPVGEAFQVQGEVLIRVRYSKAALACRLQIEPISHQQGQPLAAGLVGSLLVRRDEQSLLAFTDSEGKVIDRFGERIIYPRNLENDAFNDFFAFAIEDRVVLLFQHYPVFQIHSGKGSLLEQGEYQLPEIIKQRSISTFSGET